jgi:hypothetical protein
LYQEQAATFVEWEVNRSRREFAELQKVAGDRVALDESPLCRKCSPDAKQPSLILRIAYDDRPAHATEGVTADDVRLVREFLVGGLLHVESNDAETPLRQHLPRLEKLLGIQAEQTR